MSDLEQLHENLADVKESQEKEPGLELAKGPELDELAKVANNLASKIEGDKDVYERDLDRLKEALKKMKINFFGEELTVQELRQIPDFESNKKAWEMITTGKVFDEQFIANNLIFLTPEIAEKLLQRIGPRNFLSLRKLKNISPEVAHELSKYDGILFLIGLEKIEVASIKALIDKVHKTQIDLGIKSLSVEQAQALKDYTGIIGLRDVTAIDKETARELGESKNSHLILGLKKLSLEIAIELANFLKYKTVFPFDRSLTFESLTEISPEAVAAFSSSYHHLSFPKVPAISIEVAKEFKKFSCPISFDGFSEISDEIAQILSESKGALTFNGLTDISVSALRSFSLRSEKVYLEFLDIENMTPEHLRIIDQSNSISTSNEIMLLSIKEREK